MTPVNRATSVKAQGSRVGTAHRGRVRWAVPALLVFALLCPLPGAAQPEVGPSPKYAEAVRALERWLAREVQAKRLPALSLALVDDQEVVWARGFGHADAEGKVPATADTVYRVGSVSKPFTSLLLMMLVELGLIDLDTPVPHYLPGFHPRNPYDKPITLRQIVCHRSGLVRESPVGNYFDDSEPGLARTVASLNRTELLSEPGTKTSYSNAAVSVAGLVAERVEKEPFARLMKRKLLGPLGMKDSSFEPPPALRQRRAAAVMWTWHGREFPAPTFQLGTGPAGNLCSTANDMARFLRFLFAGGRAGDRQLLKRSTLEAMWRPQLVKAGTKTGFGIGFLVSEFEGRRRIGHGGAVYGFSTELAALPDDKLGIIVMASRDVANAVTRHVADEALRHMLAVRAGKPLPTIQETTPVDLAAARRLAGRYEAGGKAVELTESGGKLYLLPLDEGVRTELRRLGKGLITDGWLGYGLKVKPEGDRLRIKDKDYLRVAVPRPAPVPARWAGLIGEYGWDHNTLYIHERDGKLWALIEWAFLYPLTEVTEDVYRFPDYGLYQGDKLVFRRGQGGRATQVVAANVVFPRRHLRGEDGKTFTIRPQRPLAELRREALAASPPPEKGDFRRPDLVELIALDPTIKLDLRYAGTNNFLTTPFYTSAKAYMQRPAAEALVRAHRKLAKQGYGLLIFDAYRPWHVTKMFWDATPPNYHMFVADPSQGSRHNRGCAVDLTLYDRKTGKAVGMVSGFDEFSDRAYPDYPGGTSLRRWHRDTLRKAMEAEGFTVYEAEWWHFDYRDWRRYPILNVTLEKLQGPGR
jgi:CubicO group peptidase (beta-lactamase class C family)/D-alanyl-D-alanine dipeptidase